MCVVTIRGQLGSGAPEIGRLVAEGLHADYVDREIIAKVAATLEAAEEEVSAKEMPPGSLLERIAAALGRGYAVGAVHGIESYAAIYLPTRETSLDDGRYLAGLSSVIQELAAGGSIVIRGRGSQFILRDQPGALHVLTVAPLGTRVRRVLADLELDVESAKREIARTDCSSREFIKRYFHAELESPLNYDLVINTEHLTFGDAAAVVSSAVPSKERAASKG